MNEIKIEKIENFEKFVNEMQPNTRCWLPHNCRYKWVEIKMVVDYFFKKTYYTWAMEYNYTIAGTTGYIYPLTGNNKVTHFKTEKGAKSNFLRNYKELQHFFTNL